MIIKVKENIHLTHGVPVMFPFDRIGGMKLNVKRVDEEWFEIIDIIDFGQRFIHGYKLHKDWVYIPLINKLDKILE